MTSSDQLWADPGAFAFNLLALYLDRFGVEGLSWDPGTVALEVEENFHATLHPGNFEKLLTAVAILTTDAFTTSVVDFCHFCLVLSGESGGYLPDAADCAWGMTEGLLIAPPEESQENPFAAEIVGYVEEILREEGILSPPDILRIGLRDPNLLERVRYDYSDDPELFTAIHQMEQSKSDDINRLIRTRMVGLLTQLQGLQLHNGQAQKVATQLLSRLPQEGERDLLPSEKASR